MPPAPGQIVTFVFPQTNLAQTKLRPALLITQLPGPHGDWLACMISSQLHHALPGFDEILSPQSADFAPSGLRVSSVIRITRLAVVAESILIGALGAIAPDRHRWICQRLSDWLRPR